VPTGNRPLRKLPISYAQRNGCGPRGFQVSEPETHLIEAIRTGLPPGTEFDEREEALLDLAARQARDVERAEADLEERG
jgi:hypothetical protein